MKQLVIRDLDDAVLKLLQRRAWQQGVPLEEAIRRMLVLLAHGIAFSEKHQRGADGAAFGPALDPEEVDEGEVAALGGAAGVFAHRNDDQFVVA